MLYKVYNKDSILIYGKRKNALQKLLCLRIEGNDHYPYPYHVTVRDEDTDFIEDEIIVTGVIECKNNTPILHSLSAMLVPDDGKMRAEITVHGETHIYFCDSIGLGNMVIFVLIIKINCESNDEKYRVTNYIRDEYMKWRKENVQSNR